MKPLSFRFIPLSNWFVPINRDGITVRTKCLNYKTLLFQYIYYFLIYASVLPGQSLPEKDPLAQNLFQHSDYLGSDSLQGRATGSPGEKKAAEYIANYFRELGVLPAAENGSYFQQVPMHGSKVDPRSRLCIFTGSDTLQQTLTEDYLLYKSGVQTFIPKPAPLVFSGYGISAPEFDYDDYHGVDVEGKIVVFLEGEPESEDSEYFAGKSPTIHSYAESKQRTALAHGAIGSILIARINNPEDWQKRIRSFSFEDVTLAYQVSGHLGLLMHPRAAQILFEGTDFSLPEIERLAREQVLFSFPLFTQIMFRGIFAERDFVAPNVAGFLPGRKDQILIVSAHYDHLGIGIPLEGDSIYNGVMDNAMGVAAVLELAAMFKRESEQTRSGILFLLVTGEEKGLLGSSYYTDHPLHPLYKTIANVNIDGLAAFDYFNEVVGVGADLSSLGNLLKKVAVENQFSAGDIPPQFLSYESFSRSDQMSFSWAGIPSILIMDGLHYNSMSAANGLKQWLEWNEKIYHSPFDDIHQSIHWGAASQHTRFLYAYIRKLANIKTPPQWKTGLPFRNIRLQTIAEKR